MWRQLACRLLTFELVWQILAASFVALVLCACGQGGEALQTSGATATKPAATSPQRGTSTEERAPLPRSEVTPELRRAAQRLLENHADAPLGTEFSLEHEGKRYVARIEEHYHEPGGSARPYGVHRGITLYPANR